MFSNPAAPQALCFPCLTTRAIYQSALKQLVPFKSAALSFLSWTRIVFQCTVSVRVGRPLHLEQGPQQNSSNHKGTGPVRPT